MQGSRPPDCLAVAGSSRSFTAANICNPSQPVNGTSNLNESLVHLIEDNAKLQQLVVSLKREKTALLNEKKEREKEIKILQYQIKASYQKGVSIMQNALGKLFSDEQLDAMEVANKLQITLIMKLLKHWYCTATVQKLTNI